jgi:RimK family alpha-L-glutamate ligase
MKIAVLYYGEPQWTEEQLLLFFEAKGAEIDLIEYSDIDSVDFSSYDVVFNRIYASVANENDFSFSDHIDKLKMIEGAGVKLINSSFASVCDYDKYVSSMTMTEAGVLNPTTEKVSTVEEIREFMVKHNVPVIVKPNTGGRGLDIMKFDNESDVPDDLFSNVKSHSNDFIVQTLAKSSESKDYRVFVLGDDVLFANTRTLVDGWLGSRSQGSKIEVINEVEEDLVSFCVKATKSIKSEMNSLDIVKTEEGFSVIENNPTPNFNEQYVEMFGFNPVEKIVDRILEAKHEDRNSL